MNTTTMSLERRADGVFSEAEQQALLGFLGGYSGLTRDAYALDLRQFAAWCQQRQLALFEVARHDIESFARQLEDLGRARAIATAPALADIVNAALGAPAVTRHDSLRASTALANRVVGYMDRRSWLVDRRRMRR